MKSRKDGAVSRQLGILFNLGTTRDLTDGQLLERVTTGRGEVAEMAFTALVERHGPMVSRVCRALLSDRDDTLDAFQATFLILIKKSRALWVQDSLGPWLYRVAFRTATNARAASARRRRHEHRAAERAAGADRQEGRTGDDLERALHEEIARLPERYRVPIVLCDLEGLTNEEAARRMGRPVGTVKSWRSRGRERLRARLIRRGLAPAADFGATLAVETARAAIPRLNTEQSLRSVVHFLSDRLTTGEVPASVRLLVKGVLKAMLISKLRMAMVSVFALAVFAGGIGIMARVGADDSGEPVPEAPGSSLTRSPAEPPKISGKEWPLSLKEALRIGLENSEVIRVLKPVSGKDGAGGLAFTPTRADFNGQRLKAEMMAEIRSIEQSYWQLVFQQASLRSGEITVGVAEGVLDRVRQRQKSGQANVADVAEAQQRLEQFRIDLMGKTGDVSTIERQLRRLLGLTQAGDRRIIPVTVPTKTLIEPDWESCKAVMLESQPDIVEQREKLKKVEASGNVPRIEREKAFLQQVIQQTSYSLERFCREIDINFRQFETASRFRAAAAQRLEIQRASYEEGRITIDRYLDAIGQYMAAVIQMEQFKIAYNVSLVALEEAKGTLLDHEHITLVEESKGNVPAGGKRDGEARTASHQATIPDGPVTPAGTESPVAKSETAKSGLEGKTVSFQFTIGRGPRPFEIRGSFTVSPPRQDQATSP